MSQVTTCCVAVQQTAHMSTLAMSCLYIMSSTGSISLAVRHSGLAGSASCQKCSGVVQDRSMSAVPWWRPGAKPRRAMPLRLPCISSYRCPSLLLQCHAKGLRSMSSLPRLAAGLPHCTLQAAHSICVMWHHLVQICHRVCCAWQAVIMHSKPRQVCTAWCYLTRMLQAT